MENIKTNHKYNYRTELLEVLNSDYYQVPTQGRNTKAQAIKLHDLGVTKDPSMMYYEAYLHVCVRPETVSLEDRSAYTSLTSDDEFGFGIEWLVEETKAFISENPNEPPHKVITDWYEETFPKGHGDKDKHIVTDYRRYPCYTDVELEAMILKIHRGAQMPTHTGYSWAVPMSGSTLLQYFANRAEALAEVLIGILEEAPLVKPEPVKIEFNGAKADYTSPAYLARVEANRKAVEELKSHTRPRKCSCTNCRCNLKTGRP